MKKLLLLPILIYAVHAEDTIQKQMDSMQILYLQNACNSCHGNYGEGMGAAPKLQGQKEEVLLKRLTDLQKGKTRTAFGTIMVSFAKSLNPEQTVQMAKYLSSLKTVKPKERYEPEFSREGDGSS